MQDLHIDLQQIGNMNELAEQIARTLASIASYPVFPMGGVPTKVAAKVYGKSEMWVRTGIEEGWLPIGHLTSSENRVNVYISPKKLWEDTGYVWDGKKP